MATATGPLSPSSSEDAATEARRERLFTRINKIGKWFDLIGLSFITPLLRIGAGDSVKQNTRDLWRLIGAPLLAIIAFLSLWAWSAPMVQTSLVCFFFLMARRPPRSTLFPSTTRFRSRHETPPAPTPPRLETTEAAGLSARSEPMAEVRIQSVPAMQAALAPTSAPSLKTRPAAAPRLAA